MTWYQKFAPYNKTIEGALGQFVSLGTAFLTINHSIPPSIGVPVASVFGAVGVFRIWYIKNEALIEDEVNAVEDLYHGVDGVFHPEPVAPQPVASIGDVPSYPVYSLHNDLPTAALVLPASPDDAGRHTASTP